MTDLHCAEVWSTHRTIFSSHIIRGFINMLFRKIEATINNANIFDDKEEKITYTYEDMFETENEELKYKLMWLVPNAQKNEMEPILIELPQGGESFVMDPHSGEEFGYVLEGAVILMTGEDRHIVHKGETFYLSGKTRHYLKNEKKTTAKVLWVSTPPLF